MSQSNLLKEVADTCKECIGIKEMAETLRLLAMAYPEDEKIWLQGLGILMGDDPLPIDRNGQLLQIGDKIEILHYWDVAELGEKGNIVGFDFFPSYDSTCVGIFVENKTGSVHPSLIVKVDGIGK